MSLSKKVLSMPNTSHNDGFNSGAESDDSDGVMSRYAHALGRELGVQGCDAASSCLSVDSANTFVAARPKPVQETALFTMPPPPRRLWPQGASSKGTLFAYVTPRAPSAVDASNTGAHLIGATPSACSWLDSSSEHDGETSILVRPSLGLVS
jgi:hypothetical protein